MTERDRASDERPEATGQRYGWAPGEASALRQRWRGYSGDCGDPGCPLCHGDDLRREADDA